MFLFWASLTSSNKDNVKIILLYMYPSGSCFHYSASHGSANTLSNVCLLG